jgi:DNA repair exonuclease SbcCD ATPase subunit
MLNIKRVHGANFCQYPAFDYTFGPGLTCVMGMNGTGKSNLVRAVYLCLAGDVYGPNNLVRDGRLTGYVACDLECDKGPFVIRRDLKHNSKTNGVSIKHSLEAPWLDSALTKKSDIAAFMSSWLGGTTSVLEYVTFARQYKFAELITTEHMNRAKMLNALMGFDRAEKLRDILQKKSREIADMPDRSEQLARETAELERLNVALDKAQKAEAEAAIDASIETAYQNALVTLRKAPAADKDILLKRHKDLLEDAEKSLEGQKILREKLGEPVEAEAPDELSYGKHIAYQAAVDELEAEKAAAENLFCPPPPPEGVSKEERDKLQERMNALHAERDKKIADKTAYGNGVCPTCERPYDNEIDLDKLQEEIDAKNAEFYEVRERYMHMDTEIRDLEKLLHSYEVQKVQADARIANAEEKVTLYEEFREFDVEAHLASREAYNKAVQNAQAVNAADAAIRTAEKRVEEENLEIAKIEAMETATETEIKQAREIKETYGQLCSLLEQAKTLTANTRAELQAVKARIDLYMDDQSKGKVNREAKELLDFARDQLHAERLPRLAARASVNAINKAMAKYLDMFSFPYPFRLNENLDFVVDWNDSKDVDAEVLSGGEMVRAAIAMRFALMEVFKAGAGVLIVDEPTTGQDSDARTALVEVLTLAAAHFRSQNIKIVCPTHAPELAAAADGIITIGE